MEKVIIKQPKETIYSFTYRTNREIEKLIKEFINYDAKIERKIILRIKISKG